MSERLTVAVTGTVGREVVRLLEDDAAKRATAHLEGLWPGFAWPLAFAEPVLVSTDRARDELGWRPASSSREALESTRAGLGL